MKSAIDPDTNIIKLLAELNGHSANMAAISESPGGLTSEREGVWRCLNMSTRELVGGGGNISKKTKPTNQSLDPTTIPELNHE